MKKIGLIIFVLAIVSIGYWLYPRNSVGQQNVINKPSDILNQTESSPDVANIPESGAVVDLTTALKSGITTKGGILQSRTLNGNSIQHYSLTLNSRLLDIKTVSDIELVKLFEINDQQIFVIAYDQGGNQCSIKYKVIAINDKTHQLSNSFGNCLPLADSYVSESDIIFSMPQNNPYLGSDLLVKYKYHDGKVKLFQKPTKDDLKQHYAQLTAREILQIADKDGCYVGGVLIDDNSCGNGRKYCTMFKNLSTPVKDADYKTLKSFCNQ